MTDYTAIPTSVLEDRRDHDELDRINAMSKARRQAQEDAALRREADLRLQESLDNSVSEYKIHSALRIIFSTIWCAAGIAALVILARLGAIAVWLMQIGTAGFAGWLGYRIGKELD